MKKKYSGFTLIELLLVVGLISIIGAFVLQGFIKKNQQAKAQIQVQVLKGIDQSIQSAAQASTDATLPANISNARFIASNMIPTQYVGGTLALPTTDILNTFGGTIVFAPAAVVGHQGYSATLTGVPSNGCVALALQIGNISDGLTVNGTVLKAPGANTVIDPAMAANSCEPDVNGIIVTKGITRENTAVVNNSVGNIGLNNSYYVADLHPIPAGPSFTACTGGSTASGYSCACAVNEIWDGLACKAKSTHYRLPGTTVGTTTPTSATSGNMNDYQANLIAGTPANYNADLKVYVPTYITLPAAATPGVQGLVITTPGRGGANGTHNLTATSVLGDCTNGLVRPASGTGPCVSPSFTYFNGATNVTQAITTVYDTNKYKTCILGTTDGGHCMMPATTTTNTPPTTWRNTVSLPGSTALGQCINGQVWNNTTQTCGCSSNTTMVSGICQCTAPNKWNSTSNSCAP